MLNNPSILSSRLASPSPVKPLDPQVFHLSHEFISLCTKCCFSVLLKESMSSDCRKGIYFGQMKVTFSFI